MPFEDIPGTFDGLDTESTQAEPEQTTVQIPPSRKMEFLSPQSIAAPLIHPFTGTAKPEKGGPPSGKFSYQTPSAYEVLVAASKFMLPIYGLFNAGPPSAFDEYHKMAKLASEKGKTPYEKSKIYHDTFRQMRDEGWEWNKNSEFIEHIPEGMESFASAYMDTRSKEEADYVTEKIKSQAKASEILAQAPTWERWMAILLTGMFDPIMLSIPAFRLFQAKKAIQIIRASRDIKKAVAVNELALAHRIMASEEMAGMFGRGFATKKGLEVAAETAVGFTISESIIRSDLPVKSIAESTIEGVFATALSGMLGAGIAKVSQLKFKKLATSLRLAAEREAGVAAEPKFKVSHITIPAVSEIKGTRQAFKELPTFEAGLLRDIEAEIALRKMPPKEIETPNPFINTPKAELKEKIAALEMRKSGKEVIEVPAIKEEIGTRQVIKELSKLEKERLHEIDSAIEKKKLKIKEEDGVEFYGKDLTVKQLKKERSYLLQKRIGKEEFIKTPGVQATKKTVSSGVTELNPDLEIELRQMKEALEPATPKPPVEPRYGEGRSLEQLEKERSDLLSRRYTKEEFVKTPGTSERVVTIKEEIKSIDDLGMGGIPVNELSIYTNEHGMIPLVKTNDQGIPIDMNGHTMAPGMAVDEIIHKMGLDGVSPGIYMQKPGILVPESQDVFFRLVPECDLSMANTKQGIAQSDNVYSRWLVDTNRRLGITHDGFINAYRNHLRELRGKESVAGGGPLFRSRARVQSLAAKYSKKIPTIEEFSKQVYRYRALKQFGIDPPDTPKAIKEVSELYTEHIYKPLGEWAGEEGRWMRKGAMKNIDSYVAQMLDRRLIKGEEIGFDKTAAEIYAAQEGKYLDRLSPDEQIPYYKKARAYREVHSHDGLRVVERVDEQLKTKFLKTRELVIPESRPDLYQKLEPYLNTDFVAISDWYLRAVNAERWLDKFFKNDPGLAKTISDIRGNYDMRIAELPTSKLRQAAAKEKEIVTSYIGMVVDRIRGTNPAEFFGEDWLHKASETIIKVNNLRLLGGVTITSSADIAKHSIDLGVYRPWLKGIGNLVRPLKTTMKANELRKLLGIYEIALNTRINAIMDSRSSLGSGRFSRGLEKLHSGFTIVTGLSPWNQGNKTAAAVFTGDILYDSAVKIGRGKTLTRRKNLMMKEMFLNDGDLMKIAKEIESIPEASERVASIHFLNIDKWKNKELGEKVLSGMRKYVDQVISTPNPSTMGLFKDLHPIGKQIAHVKTFDTANTQFIAIRAAQYHDFQAAAGAMELIAMGAVVFAGKRILDGKELPDDPGVYFAEGVDRCGILGIGNIINMALDRAGAPSLRMLVSDEPLSRMSGRGSMDIFIGPMAGLSDDLIRGAFGTGWKAANNFYSDTGLYPYLDEVPIHEGEVHGLFGLGPYRNHPLFKPVYNAAEEYTNEALGAVP